MLFRVNVRYKRGTTPKRFETVINTDSRNKAEWLACRAIMTVQPSARITNVITTTR